MLFTFNLLTKIIFGCGSISRLGAEAKTLGKRAILVTFKSIRKLGVLDRTLEDLSLNGVEVALYEGVEANPDISSVDEGAKLAKSKGAELVIGLGGGSAMDTAKAIALTLAGEGSIWYQGRA